MDDNRPVNVFVIGAGASRHLDLPLTREILHEALLRYSMKSPHKGFSDRHLKTVVCFIDREWGLNLCETIRTYRDKGPGELPPLNLEEILTKAEQQDDRSVRDALYAVVFGLFDEMATQWWSGSTTRVLGRMRRSPVTCYDTLINYVLPVRERNVFISFNYDLFLDRAVSENVHNAVGDYHLPFKHIEEGFRDYERIRQGKRQAQDFDLLKLHGSFNWGWCPKCGGYTLKYWSDFKRMTSSVCKCGEGLEPILVPPTWDKTRHVEKLRPVWERAKDALREARRLWIIGYSFPEADREARGLFQEALGSTGVPDEVMIVDPESDTVSERLVQLAPRLDSTTFLYAPCFRLMCKALLGPLPYGNFAVDSLEAQCLTRRAAVKGAKTTWLGECPWLSLECPRPGVCRLPQG